MTDCIKLFIDALPIKQCYLFQSSFLGKPHTWKYKSQLSMPLVSPSQSFDYSPNFQNGGTEIDLWFFEIEYNHGLRTGE